MRSLLFVPGDSPRKLDKGLGSGADALILDLEDSVALETKPAARETTAGFLRQMQGQGPLLLVRVNALDTGLTDADLDAVLPGRPHGILLPKSVSGADVRLLEAKIAAREALLDIPDGATRILVIATETARSIFHMGTYAGASPRLDGLTWGAEDLSADLGAAANRLPDGRHAEPYRLARTLCLFAAVAAEAQAIDTVYTNFRDQDGLRREAEEAARDGFTGKLAIHPAQVPVINEVFTPSPEAVRRAEAVVAAFAERPGAGVVGVAGEMLDRPHLTRAERLLERARQANAARGAGATA
ncbi:MAG: CoA ester lyase [Pseudomonadota bacterium]|nr:CoA ester lyase [Pseudomonadota bacterium]